jgi:uncharacterized phage infection (PIP) family protein YhgE
MASLEAVIETQRSEIGKWNLERRRLAELLERHNQITVALEATAETEASRAKELEGKAKRLQTDNRKLQEAVARVENGSALMAQITEKLIPRVNNELRVKLGKIAHDQLTPISNRIQQIIDEIVAVLNRPPPPVQIEPKDDGREQKLMTVLSGLFHAFQSQFRDEKAIPGLEARDSDFVEFLASRCIQLDAVLKENEFISPQFISMDFLFNGSLEDRKQILQQIRTSGWDAPATFDLFCAQILVTIAQRHELDVLKQMATEQGIQIEQIQTALGCSDLSTADEIAQKINKKIRNLRTRSHKLQELLKARDAYDAEHPSVPEYERTIKSIEAKNAELEKDLQSVVADATALQRELDVKLQQIASLEKSHQALIDESTLHQQKHVDEISGLEKVIDERNREIRDLHLNLTKLTSDTEQQLESLRKASKELREKMTSRTEKFKRNLALLEQRKKNVEQQMLAKLRAKERQNQEDSSRMAAAQNELQERLEAQLQAMREQTQGHHELSQKLSGSLAETEKRNQQLTSEISRLNVAKKSLEVQLKTSGDQLKREAQILASQAAMRAMNAETRFQEELNALKSRFVKEKNELITSVLAEFDQLEQFEDDEISDSAFLRVMEQIAKKVREGYAYHV